MERGVTLGARTRRQSFCTVDRGMMTSSETPVREPERDVERPPRKDPGRPKGPIEEPPPGPGDDPDPADDPAPIDEPGDMNDGQDRDPGIDEPEPPARTPQESQPAAQETTRKEQVHV